MTKSIRPEDVELVRELLRNARENGYSMEGHSAGFIAMDMGRFAPDVETWSDEYLVAVIQEVMPQTR